MGCVAISHSLPPTSASLRARVTSYSTTERHGLVWVCLNSAHSPVPQFPEYEDPAFRTVALDEPVATAASAMRVILGTLDDTHFDGCTKASSGVATMQRRQAMKYGAKHNPQVSL